MEIMIINQQNRVNYNQDLQEVIISVAQNVGKLAKLPDSSEVSILIVDNNYIQELNFIYRGINQTTDVLSFPLDEFAEEEADYDLVGDVHLLGDIVISLEKAVEQSGEYNHSLEREVGYLIAHGMLHLLGYDHETIDEKKAMRALEEKIMKKVKLER